METRFYEMGADGRLVPSVSKFDDLQPGAVIHWGGNAGFSETDFCILTKIPGNYGTMYDCYNLSDKGKNARLQRVEARSIKSEDDPALWHSQHYFIQPETVDPETVALYRAHHEELRAAFDKHQADLTAESDRLEALGRELWPSLIGECPAVIIAEHEKNVSDSMTDYFASQTIDRVILAPSKHTRDLFSEMRKAADLLPETQHLGTGKGQFSPYVAIGKTFRDNGACYYEGSGSHWHRELDRDENYNTLKFTTRAEAEAYIASKGEPEPISFDGEIVSFYWKIAEDDIEHREKYSMGKGYYLGTNTYSGWQVSKEVFHKDGPRRGDYITLAKRHDHLVKGKPEAPKAPETPAGPFAVTHDRDWTWVTFADKPAENVLQALKDAGGRFSHKRAAWYFTRHVEAEEITSMVGDPIVTVAELPEPVKPSRYALMEDD